MFRYRLRTLLILTILGPPAAAWAIHAAWERYDDWRWRAALDAAQQIQPHGQGLTIAPDP